MKKSLLLSGILSAVFCVYVHSHGEMKSLQGIKYIEYTFADFLGNRKSIIRPIEYVQEDMKKGLSVDGSSLLGCKRITDSDMLIMPDSTVPFFKVPWTKNMQETITMARVMCTLHIDEQTPYEADPRALLKKELEVLKDAGFELLIGPELEFYVFFDNETEKALMPIDSYGYADSAHQVWIDNFTVMIMNILAECGLECEKIHHEVGQGQFEISLKHGNALNIADAIITAKNMLEMFVTHYGKRISFMPKPLTGKPGSGMHINFSLRALETKANAFYDASLEYNLSTFGKRFIAGILHYVPDFTLVLNSSLNSYKRLGGHEAPKYICCGQKNRSALIRLPFSSNAEGVRAEIRSPDALCNPYLTFATLLHAGMEGIEQEYDLQFVSDNLYEVDQQTVQERNIQRLPTTFQEALTYFESSSFMQNFLGKTLFENYVNYKREELHAFNQAITQWEISNYFAN